MGFRTDFEKLLALDVNLDIIHGFLAVLALVRKHVQSIDHQNSAFKARHTYSSHFFFQILPPKSLPSLYVSVVYPKAVKGVHLGQAKHSYFSSYEGYVHEFNFR